MSDMWPWPTESETIRALRTALAAEKERADRAEVALRDSHEQEERLERQLVKQAKAADEYWAERDALRTALAAEKERSDRAEAKFREFEYEVMTGRSEQHDRLVAERDALRADLSAAERRAEEAEGLLREARPLMGIQAGKRGLAKQQEILARVDAALSGRKEGRR